MVAAQHFERTSVEGRQTPGEVTGRAVKQHSAAGRVRGTGQSLLRQREDPGRTKVAKEGWTSVHVDGAPRQEDIKGMVDAAALFGVMHGNPTEYLGDPTGDGGRSWREWRRKRATTKGSREIPNHNEQSLCSPRPMKPREIFGVVRASGTSE